jgi:hypothetical protein
MPVHPIRRASAVIGASEARVYALLKTGELTAVTLGGKTLVTTASLVNYLAKAQPWRPNFDRVVRAVQARPDVMAKKAAARAACASEATQGAHR